MPAGTSVHVDTTPFPTETAVHPQGQSGVSLTQDRSSKYVGHDGSQTDSLQGAHTRYGAAGVVPLLAEVCPSSWSLVCQDSLALAVLVVSQSVSGYACSQKGVPVTATSIAVTLSWSTWCLNSGHPLEKTVHGGKALACRLIKGI